MMMREEEERSRDAGKSVYTRGRGGMSFWTNSNRNNSTMNQNQISNDDNKSNTNTQSPSFNINLAAMGDGMKRRLGSMYASFQNKNNPRGNMRNSSRNQPSTDHRPLISANRDAEDDEEEEVIFFGSKSSGNKYHRGQSLGAGTYNGKASFGGVEMSDLSLSPSKTNRKE